MRAKKRRRWTSQEKLRIVLAGLDRSSQLSELRCPERISPTQYYDWKKQPLGAARKIFEDRRSAKPSARGRKGAREKGSPENGPECSVEDPLREACLRPMTVPISVRNRRQRRPHTEQMGLFY